MSFNPYSLNSSIITIGELEVLVAILITVSVRLFAIVLFPSVFSKKKPSTASYSPEVTVIFSFVLYESKTSVSVTVAVLDGKLAIYASYVAITDGKPLVTFVTPLGLAPRFLPNAFPSSPLNDPGPLPLIKSCALPKSF